MKTTWYWVHRQGSDTTLNSFLSVSTTSSAASLPYPAQLVCHASKSWAAFLTLIESEVSVDLMVPGDIFVATLHHPCVHVAPPISAIPFIGGGHSRMLGNVTRSSLSDVFEKFWYSVAGDRCSVSLDLWSLKSEMAGSWFVATGVLLLGFAPFRGPLELLVGEPGSLIRSFTCWWAARLSTLPGLPLFPCRPPDFIRLSLGFSRASIWKSPELINQLTLISFKNCVIVWTSNKYLK